MGDPPVTAPVPGGEPPAIGELLADALRRDADSLVVDAEDGLLTRGGLARASFRLAHRCVAAGGGPGRWVAVLLPPGLDAVIGFVGATRSGAGVASLDPRRGTDEVVRLLGRISTGVAVTTAAWAPILSSIGVTPLIVDRAEAGADADGDADGLGALPRPAPSDPASVTFTSGSSGRPKGIVRGHASRSASFTRAGAGVAGGAEARISVVSPFGPPAALVSLFTAIRTGSVLCPYDVSAAGIAAYVDFLEQRHVTSLRVPVAVYRALVDALGSRRLEEIREISLGGEAVLPSDVDALGRCFSPGAELSYSYGLTEAASLATARFGPGDSLPPGPIRFTTLLPGARLSIEGPDGAGLPVGTVGEIVVRGSTVADGYLDDPDLEAERFFTDPDGSRGFRTGDLGLLLDGGVLELAGRHDDQVKVRGHAVRVGQVEEALREVAGVADCAVVAVPDEREGARLVAFVVGAERVPPAIGDLRRGLAARLPSFMVPSGFRTLTTLPRLPEGKVDRQRLLAEGAEALPRSAPWRDALIGTEAIVRAAFGRVLGFSDPSHDVGCDDDFFELGGNSLAALEVLAVLEKELSVRIDVPALVAHPTVAGLAAEAERIVKAGDGGSGGRDRFLHLPGPAAGPAIVLYPGTADSVLHVVPLARRLPLDVHARLARGIDETDPAPTRRLSQRALVAEEAAHVAALPPGPLVLAGHSGGGALALEVAHRLRRDGREVPLVVLLDSVNPGGPWRRLRQRIASRGGTVPLSEARLSVAAFADAARRRMRRAWHHGAAAPVGVDPAATALTAALRAQRNRLYLEAADRSLFHRLPRYEGDVLLMIATRGGPRTEVLGPDLGWRRCVRGTLWTSPVDGDHTSILEPPDVESLAAVIGEHLSRAGLLRDA